MIPQDALTSYQILDMVCADRSHTCPGSEGSPDIPVVSASNHVCSSRRVRLPLEFVGIMSVPEKANNPSISRLHSSHRPAAKRTDVRVIYRCILHAAQHCCMPLPIAWQEGLGPISMLMRARV